MYCLSVNRNFLHWWEIIIRWKLLSNYQTVCLVETILTRGKQHLSLNIFGELAKKRIFDDAVQVSGVIGGQKLKKFGSDFLDQKSEQRKKSIFFTAFQPFSALQFISFGTKNMLECPAKSWQKSSLHSPSKASGKLGIFLCSDFWSKKSLPNFFNFCPPMTRTNLNRVIKKYGSQPIPQKTF